MSELDAILTESDDGWVDGVLAEARSASDAELAEMDLAAGFDELLSEIWVAGEALGPLRSRSRARRAVVSLAVVGGLLGTGGVVAAAAGVSYRSIGGALTGQFGQPGMTENDTSEIVNLTAPDFPTVAQQLAGELRKSGLRFAPGYDAQRNIDAAIDRMQHGLAGETDVTGVKGQLADVAACTWERSWLAADQLHDQAGMQAASAGLHQTAGLRIMSQINNAKWLAGLAKDADGGDAAPVQTDVNLNCPAALK